MATPTLRLVQPNTKPQRATRTTVDTILITPEVVKSWKSPPFQRPLRVNDKVRQLAEVMKEDGGVIPGIITIGVFEKQRYLLDGQHRREAFLLSECKEGYVDIRMHHFETMAEMGEEFVNLNSRIVTMGPDDIMRGLEGSVEAISRVRKKCPYVGYDQIRRGTSSPIVSMSAVFRCWMSAAQETPSCRAMSAINIANSITADEADLMIAFLQCCNQAWGRDLEYGRLWGNLNLALCMWLYRRTVIGRHSDRSVQMTKEMFTKLLMGLSANSLYIDWLTGRSIRERDRAPAYGRIKSLFVKRYEVETGKRPVFPQPAWAMHARSDIAL